MTQEEVPVIAGGGRVGAPHPAAGQSDRIPDFVGCFIGHTVPARCAGRRQTQMTAVQVVYADGIRAGLFAGTRHPAGDT